MCLRLPPPAFASSEPHKNLGLDCTGMIENGHRGLNSGYETRVDALPSFTTRNWMMIQNRLSPVAATTAPSAERQDWW